MIKDKILFLYLFLIFTFLFSTIVIAAPIGPIIEYLSNSSSVTPSAYMLNTSGGEITTIQINATTQNLKWKAYVGNVSGKLTLDDASNYTIYDWSLTTIAGEVYATRNPSTVSWASIICANYTHVAQEEDEINITHTREDSINSTFRYTAHKEFDVGTVSFGQSWCNQTTATYVNDTRQTVTATSLFQEILLYDGNDLVYTTILEQDQYGYRGNLNYTYDFQILLAENGLDSFDSSTAYYFYTEII